MVNLKERIMAAFRGEEPDRIPWMILSILLPRGRIEREMRNMGLGLVSWTSMCEEETPNVKVEVNTTGGMRETIYRTPIGSVSSKQRISGLGYDTSWTTEFMIKDASDYDVAAFMVEDAVYRPDYDPFLDEERELGDDGIVCAPGKRSPLQQLLLELMGYRRFSIDLYRNRSEFEKLLRVMEDKTLEYYRIVADSPAEIVWVPDNINGTVTSPKIFEKYCIPFYNKLAHILHSKGKIISIHMDGRLRSLLNLIPKAEIDSIDGFTPPPVGNLPIREARDIWGDNYTIWSNFPPTVFLHGADAIRKCTIEMLRNAAPGDRFIMGVTENIPSDILDVSLKTVTKTMAEHGKYPISF